MLSTRPYILYETGPKFPLPSFVRFASLTARFTFRRIQPASHYIIQESRHIKMSACGVDNPSVLLYAYGGLRVAQQHGQQIGTGEKSSSDSDLLRDCSLPFVPPSSKYDPAVSFVVSLVSDPLQTKATLSFPSLSL